MEIGRTIRDLRNARGITQEIFAEEIGVSVQSVSRWENGVNCPDITLLPAIADYFNVTTDCLLGRERKELMAKLLKTTEVFEVADEASARKLVEKFSGESFPKLLSHRTEPRGGAIILTVEKEFGVDPEKMQFH